MLLNLIWAILNVILIAGISSIFCNAVENFGEKLGISEGVTGAVFAAIATALPETIIPVLALITEPKSQGDIGADISIGAILGAPFMLSTLALFIVTISTLKKRGLTGVIKPERSGVYRDLKFFSIGYILVIIAAFIPHGDLYRYFCYFIAILLFITYISYLYFTVKASKKLIEIGHQTVANNKLLLSSLGLKDTMPIISIQLIFSIIMLILVAKFFIINVVNLSQALNLSTFFISIVLIPIATEMPEKMNSIIWLKQRKDTLAISNITGAMVFQGTLLPIIGILYTNWTIANPIHMISIGATLLATLLFYVKLKRGELHVWMFISNMIIYIISILISFYLS